MGGCLLSLEDLLIEEKPVLFLDLDGTVRTSKTGEFIDGKDDIKIIEGRKEALSSYQDHVIVGVTNQGGVAHGHKTPDQVHEENEKTNELLGGVFDFIEFSPCHSESDDEVFGRKSLLRKPMIGMLVRAEAKLIQDYHIFPNYDDSIMVGDREEDQECANRAGISFQWAEDFFA